MASLLNNASLLLNPAGSIISYQEDKIYSVLPKDGTGDFTFSGGDGGTRVNQQGYIEVTPANLILNSQEVALWATNASPTINSNVATAPNGTFTADRINAAAAYASGVYQIFTSVSGQTYTLSVSIKNDSSATSLLIGNDANPGTGYVLFNPTTGVITSVAGSVTASSVIDEGNGWYRVSITYVSTGTPNAFVIYSVTSTVNSFFVWGAMANIGSTAKPYQPTTDRLNYPRITYQNGRGALLGEPQRTNLITYSQQFDNAAWEKAVATVTANTTISPDGTQNADTITCNGTGYQYVRQNIFGGTNQSCACSVYVKRGSARYFAFRNSGNTSNHDVFDFDSSAWVTNNTGATLSYEVLKDGWFRLMSVNSNVNNFYWSCFPTDSTSGAEVTTSSNLTVYVWGGQGEQNATYVSSYIPTTSATVTRPADSTNNTNTTNVASVVGQTEGVFYSDLYFEANGAEKNYMYLNTNGSYVNGFFYLISLANNKLAVDIYNFPNTAQFSSQSPTLTTGRYKAAIAYKQNDFAFYLNGVLMPSVLSGTVPTLNRMFIGQGSDLGWTQGGPVFTTGFLPTRLTNTQLAELTTVRSGSGGTISYYGPYTIHTFTGSATFTPSFTGPVEVLVVAGGGGGGFDFGGGGGAGGLLYASSYGVAQGTGITVTIGAGGAGAPAGGQSTSGGNSVFGGLTAIGGGGGANGSGPSSYGLVKNGGSGGGAGGWTNALRTISGSGIPGQGFDGGIGDSADNNAGAGGGGGAGQKGQNAIGLTAGDGGDGLSYSITGFSTYYAGGGGGGTYPGTSIPGTGGLGGGGNGAAGININGYAAVAYTGGGGGGNSGGGGGSGGNGGSGIVIVRYLT